MAVGRNRTVEVIMKKHVDLSISIVSYYSYDEVSRLLETIEKYTSPELKKVVYIIDNGNQAGEYAGLQYEDVVYMNTGTNLGFGAGHNYVLDQLDSDYHAIVNPDILLTEDSFGRILEFMEHNEAGMCIPRLTDAGGNRLQVYRREITVLDVFIRMFCRGLFKKRAAYHTLEGQDYSEPFLVPFAQGSFLVIRTELWKQLGGFDERYFMYLEDADLCKRVNEISGVIYYPGTSVIHEWKRESHRNKKLFKCHLRSMHEYFRKWGYRWH